MKKTLKEERGNTMLLTLGMVFVMALMLVVILNFANVFVVKEVASSNAEQASLVGASLVVEKLKEEIENYEDSLLGLIEEVVDETITEKIENRKNEIKYETNWLEHELELKAMNDVLEKELRDGNIVLRGYIITALNRATNEMPHLVQSNIVANKGEVGGTRIRFNSDYRLEVETYVEFSMIKMENYVSDDKQKVKQTGESPSFSFLKELPFYSWSYTFP